jgi:diguanylate cyclase (GGDEF)-like protein
MASWKETLEELGQEYLRSGEKRVDQMSKRLQNLGDSQGAAAALIELCSHFHSFAISGAAYGLPEVGRQGALGERRCLGITDRDGSPTPADLAALCQTVEALRSELALSKRLLPVAALDLGLPRPAAQWVDDLIERDSLTGLFNQAIFLEYARAAVADFSREPGRQIALVLLDLDQFGSINDRYGYASGDGVLRALAGLLRQLRPWDIVGNWGGGRFEILLEDVEPRDAAALVDRLRMKFRALSHAGPKKTSFHASVNAGIAFLSPGMDIAGWRQSADQALVWIQTLSWARNKEAADLMPDAGPCFPIWRPSVPCGAMPESFSVNSP